MFFSVGKKIRRRQSDRDAVARQNVWQVLDQSPAAWRVNGGTGKNTNTIFSPCKAPRNRLYLVRQNPQRLSDTASSLGLRRSCRRFQAFNPAPKFSRQLKAAPLVTNHKSRVTSSNTCHTNPISDSTGPPNASPPETHAAPADKPPAPPPPHTASIRDKAPGS